MRKYPNEKQALFSLAGRYSSLEQHDKAIVLYERVIRLDPSWAAPVNALAYEYYDDGRYERALELIERYIVMSPGDANPLDSKAEILYAMGDLDRSIQWYRRAVESKPDFYASMESIHFIYGIKGDFDSALVWAGRYLGAVPHPMMRLSGHLYRSVYLVRTGRVSEAFEDLDAARALGGTQRHPLARLGSLFTRMMVQAELGRYRDAAVTGVEIHRVNETAEPQSVRRWNMVLAYMDGIVNCGLGEYGEARDDVRRFGAMESGLETYDINAITTTVLALLPLVEAELLLAGDRPREAAALIDTGFTLRPPRNNLPIRMITNFPPEQDVQARALLALGDTAGALAVYEKLIAFDPSSSDRRLRNPRYHYRAGVLYEAAGRRERAAAHYERFLEYMKRADADAPFVEDARRRLRALR